MMWLIPLILDWITLPRVTNAAFAALCFWAALGGRAASVATLTGALYLILALA